jgi:hypothetical protein
MVRLLRGTSGPFLVARSCRGDPEVVVHSSGGVQEVWAVLVLGVLVCSLQLTKLGVEHESMVSCMPPMCKIYQRILDMCADFNIAPKVECR